MRYIHDMCMANAVRGLVEYIMVRVMCHEVGQDRVGLGLNFTIGVHYGKRVMCHEVGQDRVGLGLNFTINKV